MLVRATTHFEWQQQRTCTYESGPLNIHCIYFRKEIRTNENREPPIMRLSLSTECNMRFFFLFNVVSYMYKVGGLFAMAQCRFLHVYLKVCILIDTGIDIDKETVHHVATGRFIKTKKTTYYASVSLFIVWK